MYLDTIVLLKTALQPILSQNYTLAEIGCITIFRSTMYLDTIVSLKTALQPILSQNYGFIKTALCFGTAPTLNYNSVADPSFCTLNSAFCIQYIELE